MRHSEKLSTTVVPTTILLLLLLLCTTWCNGIIYTAARTVDDLLYNLSFVYHRHAERANNITKPNKEI